MQNNEIENCLQKPRIFQLSYQNPPPWLNSFNNCSDGAFCKRKRSICIHCFPDSYSRVYSSCLSAIDFYLFVQEQRQARRLCFQVKVWSSILRYLQQIEGSLLVCSPLLAQKTNYCNTYYCA